MRNLTDLNNNYNWWLMSLLITCVLITGCSYNPFNKSRGDLLMERQIELEKQQLATEQEQMDFACRKRGGVIQYSHWKLVRCMDMEFVNWKDNDYKGVPNE